MDGLHRGQSRSRDEGARGITVGPNCFTCSALIAPRPSFPSVLCDRVELGTCSGENNSESSPDKPLGHRFGLAAARLTVGCAGGGNAGVWLQVAWSSSASNSDGLQPSYL